MTKSINNILVTGGAGYIGSHIVENLVKTKNRVIILDNLVTGYERLINKKAKFIKADIKNKKDLIKAGKISKNLIYFKKKMLNKKKIDKLVLTKKKELEKLYNISFEYFEIRNKKNLEISKDFNNSKLFIAYYLDKIRLIDNF